MSRRLAGSRLRIKLPKVSSSPRARASAASIRGMGSYLYYAFSTLNNFYQERT